MGNKVKQRKDVVVRLVPDRRTDQGVNKRQELRVRIEGSQIEVYPIENIFQKLSASLRGSSLGFLKQNPSVLSDISQLGAGLILSKAVRSNSHLMLRIKFPKIRSLTLFGEVRYVKPFKRESQHLFRVGITFCQSSRGIFQCSQDLSDLQAYLRRLTRDIVV